MLDKNNSLINNVLVGWWLTSLLIHLASDTVKRELRREKYYRAAATRGKQQHTQITHLVFGLSSVNNSDLTGRVVLLKLTKKPIDDSAADVSIIR